MLRAIVSTFLLSLAWTSVARSQDFPPVVDVELVLAVDVSWSMDIDEQRLQREGYVNAIRDPEVIRAIRRGDWGRIAVTYVEWAGVGLQRTVVPWSIIESQRDADLFAKALGEASIGRMRRTSISSALLMSAALFDNGIDGFRKVIDVSGDGPNNMGPMVTEARDRVIRQGITINGLPIMVKQRIRGDFFQIENLDEYYRGCVIGGMGSFMITIESREQFGQAIRRKLILEIAGAQPTVQKAQIEVPQSVAVDCMVGEKQWRRWRRFDQW
ncbi:DUF1194 domain-containing protein [Acuticoccus sp. I52.16.1]|uniref:DUF1194 domain-containing protein n=1 Tax=Acuticoccus sp. I52.16.1 TaxID=2928472 RepID=UPI001FCFF751|nr:DUF1194 domain-containing protein [Acuticoccus sp. I52.16.1]UOM33562.1 DUF1194 domain-containing protein [Acuticoccus sp. I52.16.1]